MRKLLPDCPLDSVMLELFRHMRATGVDYFLVGATARDILLTKVFGQSAGRATRDVDLAVAVHDWLHFERLKQALEDSGQFKRVAGNASRLHYQPEGIGPAYPLDLIPYGGVEDGSSQFAWPPDMTVIMSVAGYADARVAAELVQVAPDLSIAVASLPGLAMLKLFAWQERGRENAKDALDLFTLMHSYAAAGNTDRLYGDAFEILVHCEYDTELAGAVLLGCDVALTASADARKRLLALLAQPDSVERLAMSMLSKSAAAAGLPGKARDYLAGFTRGLLGLAQ